MMDDEVGVEGDEEEEEDFDEEDDEEEEWCFITILYLKSTRV